MAQVGDILRATHFYTYLGQECLNVFFYEVDTLTDPGANPFAWSEAYAEDFRTQVMAIQSTGVILNRINWENLTNGVEIAEFSTNKQGARSGDQLPSSVAFGFILRRSTGVTRNGYKRFVGVHDGAVNGNIVSMDATQRANAEEWLQTGFLGLDYDGGGNNVQLTPVIIGRTKNGQGVYEIDLSKKNYVADAQLRGTVSTQNSRKP